MEVSKKESKIFFADFETSYTNEKQKNIKCTTENGKVSLKKIAERERYSQLINIQNLEGTIDEIFASGEKTMEDFFYYLKRTNDELLKENKNADMQVYTHNLKYDWAYLEYFICKVFHGIRKATNNICYEEIRDDTGLYKATIYYDIKAKCNLTKTVKINGAEKEVQVYDQDGKPVKEYTYKKITFLDNYKIFPVPLATLGDVIGLPKLGDTYDYEKVYDYNWRPTDGCNEVIYIKRDVEIMRKFFIKANDYAKAKMTLAGNSLQYYKNITFNDENDKMSINGIVYDKFEDMFPNRYVDKYKHTKMKIRYKTRILLNEEMTIEEVNGFVRSGYTGGVTQVNNRHIGKFLIYKDYKNKEALIKTLEENNKPYEITDGMEIVIDVNSLYPYIMKTAKLPYGVPTVIKNPNENYLKELASRDDRFVIVEIDGLEGKLRENCLPTIPVSRCDKIDGEPLYREVLNNVYLVVNYEEFLLHQKNYEVTDYVICRAVVYHASKGKIFKKYIEEFSSMKENASRIINEYEADVTSHTHDDYILAKYEKLIAKLFLNTLYGKFGTSPDKSNKQKYFNEITGSWETKIFSKYWENENGEKIEYGRKSSYIFPALASAVTSYARMLLFNTINKIPYDYFIYCDTDSIHFLDNDVYGLKEMKADGIIDSNILGKWKHEETCECSIYLAPKKYAFINNKHDFEIKCAGLPDDAKKEIPTIDLFYYGYKATSKLQSFYVKGGIDLLPANFIINPPKYMKDDIENNLDDDCINVYI